MATDGQREQAIETYMEGIWGPRLPSRRAGFLTGRKDRVIERIGAYLDAGAEQINLVVRAPFDAESLQQFAEEVLPAFPTAA
jgi:alkanesulfonate monooxygenase SsuD/methylene tetrahydromethanopterin reductase-like flavin-dependent oxidoreductase (luciferase family)